MCSFVTEDNCIVFSIEVLFLFALGDNLLLGLAASWCLQNIRSIICFHLEKNKLEIANKSRFYEKKKFKMPPL